MRDFKKLAVWDKAHALALELYAKTSAFPGPELYGLTSQIRRAGLSVPTNIAEGCGRDSDAELGRFLRIAMGSANEIEYLLLVARDLNYLSGPQYDSLSVQLLEVKRMLAGFIRRLVADALNT
jgi:four helix bundle protein